MSAKEKDLDPVDVIKTPFVSKDVSSATQIIKPNNSDERPKSAQERKEKQSPLAQLHHDMQHNESHEFNRLAGLTYLDHAGTTLYSSSQVRAMMQDLEANMYGNPHSRNHMTSQRTLDRMDDVRHQVFRFFSADPLEYDLVFTSGATGSIQHIGQSFPWSRHSEFWCVR